MIHDVVPWKFTQTLSVKGRLIIVPRMKAALKNADKIITVSHTAKNELLALRGDARVVVIANPFEPSVAKSVFEKLGIEKKKYLLSVSTLEPRKNFAYLMQVADSLFDSHPELKLVVVGRIGWGKLSYHPRHAENFVFTGYVHDNDLQELYQQAKAFITLPIDEGFGRTPVEAALCGVPVAVSDIPVFHEIFGEECLYLPLDDVEKCSVLLNEAIFNQKLKVADATVFNRYKIDSVIQAIPSDLCEFEGAL